MPTNAPGLGFMQWARRMTAEDPRITRLREQGVLEPQDEPGLIERLAGTAGGALPWVPGAMGYERTPEDVPYLAQLGRIAGFGMGMRGGVGSPRWMLNPRQVGPSGEAIRPTITPEMVVAAKAGNEQARAAVVDSLQDMVAKVARKYVKADQPTAAFEDLMAEGNVTVLRVLNSEKTPEAFLPYVRSAVEKGIARFALGQRKITKSGEPIAEHAGLEDVAARVREMPRKDVNAALNAAMSKLPPKQQEAVSLYLGLGEGEPMVIEDVAKSLGQAYSGVYNKIHRGLATLKTEIQKLGLEPSDLVPETQKAPPTRVPRAERIEKPVSEAMTPESISPTELPPGVKPISGGSDVELGSLNPYKPKPKDPFHEEWQRAYENYLDTRDQVLTQTRNPDVDFRGASRGDYTRRIGLSDPTLLPVQSGGGPYDPAGYVNLPPPKPGGVSPAYEKFIDDLRIGQLKQRPVEPDPEVVRQLQARQGMFSNDIDTSITGTPEWQRNHASITQSQKAKQEAGYTSGEGLWPKDTNVPILDTGETKATMMGMKSEAWLPTTQPDIYGKTWTGEEVTKLLADLYRQGLWP